MQRDIIAAVARLPGVAFSIENLTIEGPRAGELLVKIEGVGLCHSDILARDGTIPVKLPAVFGHEGAGEVVAVGEGVSRHSVGDKVLLTFGYCGSCQRCKRGDLPYCDHSGLLNYSGGRADGSRALRTCEDEVSSNFFSQSSFANYAIASDLSAVPIPKGLPVALMGPLGCGVQTGAGGIMTTLKCEAGSSVLITGGGSLGLSAVLGAVVQGCATIIVSEPFETRRQLALELGATHVLDPGAGDLASAVRDIAPQGINYAFDSTANANVLAAAISCLGVRGKLAIAGVPKSPVAAISVPILPMVGMGQSIMGEVEGDSQPQEFLPKLMKLYGEGRFPFDRLLTTYDLKDINKAVDDHSSGACVKAVLLP